jgi:hypothetical protein
MGSVVFESDGLDTTVSICDGSVERRELVGDKQSRARGSSVYSLAENVNK